MELSSAQIATINMELTINGSPAEVWNALTEKIGEWWPDDFYAGGTAGKRGFRLDTQPGGHMHEHWENGGGALWGTVVASEPEKCLQVLGNVFPNWGGPCQWYGTWQLAPEGKQTRLSFSESAFGRISENVMDEKDKGWKFLWASLKAHVEGRPAPDWGEQ